MEEPPEGENHGFSVAGFSDESETPRRSRRDLSLRVARMEQSSQWTDGDSRFGVVTGKDDGGMVAHRGVLHPDEYVDFFALREGVEADLGFSYSDVSEAYSTGRPTAEKLQLREKIDARLLGLSRAGGNMVQLAK